MGTHGRSDRPLLFVVVVNFVRHLSHSRSVASEPSGRCAGALPHQFRHTRIPALAMVLLQHAGQYVFTTISGAVLYVTAASTSGYRSPTRRLRFLAARRLRPFRLAIDETVLA